MMQISTTTSVKIDKETVIRRVLLEKYKQYVIDKHLNSEDWH